MRFGSLVELLQKLRSWLVRLVESLIDKNSSSVPQLILRSNKLIHVLNAGIMPLSLQHILVSQLDKGVNFTRVSDMRIFPKQVARIDFGLNRSHQGISNFTF